MKNQDQKYNDYKKKTELKGFHDLTKLDEFIQLSLEKFKLVEPMQKLYDATKNDANSIVSHKSTIPDLVIWNKTFNKNECFYDADITKDNPFPRFQFYLRIKGTKNDKDKKNNKEKNKNKKFKKKDINENEKKDKNKKKENEIKNLNQLLNNNNNQNEMNKIVSKMKEIGINGDIKDSEKIIPQDLEYLDDLTKKTEKKNEQEKENEYENFNEMDLNKIFEKDEIEDNQDNKEFNLEQMNPMNRFKMSKNDFFNENNDEQKQIFNSQINNNNDYNISDLNSNNNFNNLNDINPLLKGKEDNENLNINQFQNQFDDKKQKKKNSIKKKKTPKNQNLNPQNNNNINNNLNNYNFMLNKYNNLFMQGMQNNYYNQNQNQGNINMNLQNQFKQNEYLLNLFGNNYNRRGWIIFNNERKIFDILSSYNLFQFLTQNLQNNNLSYIFIKDIDTNQIFNGVQMYFILSQTLPMIIQTRRQMLMKNNMNNMNNMNIKQNTNPFNYNQNMNNNLLSFSNQQNLSQTTIDQLLNNIDMK